MKEEIPTGEDLTFEKVWLMFKDTDTRIKELSQETDARMEKLNQETNKKISELGDKWGRFVEGVVEPSMVRLFNERGITIQETAQRLKKRIDGESIEVDLLGINGEEVVVVEVKSRLTVEDVRDHLYRLENFKRFFPRYADNRLIGAVAGMVIVEEADKFAYRQGLFVIKPSGDTAQLLKDVEFQPKHW